MSRDSTTGARCFVARRSIGRKATPIIAVIDACPAAAMYSLPTESLLLAITAFVFLLAGFVKGVVGLGLPTITMGLLSLAMTPAQAAALLVVPSLVTNVWQLGARRG